MDESKLYNEPELWTQHKGARNLTIGLGLRMIDGNTIEAEFVDDDSYAVRLAGVDAPALSEPFGEEARDCLSSLHEADDEFPSFSLDHFVFDESAKTAAGVVYFNSDTWHRTGGQQGLRSANYQIVGLGLARASSRYGEFEGMYHAEDAARAEGLGIWGGESVVGPGSSGGIRDEYGGDGDGVVDEEVYGVPEALPMTALLMMAVGMSWAYQSGVWGLWTMASYALADAVPVGTFVARWVIWALMGIAALTAVPAIYLAAYTTLSKFKVGLPAGLPGASRPLYIVGAMGAAAAALLGGFLTAVCVVDPLELPQLSGRGEFAPTLTEYFRGLSGGTVAAYPLSQEWRVLQISKPWALYLFVTSYCGVIAALTLAALATGQKRLKGLPWRVGWNLGWTLGAPVRAVYLLTFRRLRGLVFMAVAWAVVWATCNTGLQWLILD